MREKDYEKKVKSFLKDQGAWFVKTWSNGIQKEGIPDILACVNGYFIGIEVKAEKGHPSDLQLLNIRRIRDANGIAMVLYPEHYDLFVTMVQFIVKDDEPISFCIGTDAFDKRLTERERRILHGGT